MFSVIIPTYNEAAQIATTILQVQRANQGFDLEVLVVDGHSTDLTRDIAGSLGATVVLARQKGRAAQMNDGAARARYPVLYFLHADSLPPQQFTAQIASALKEGFGCGCFRLAFDEPHWFLTANAWFTRFDVNALRFGDQSLFATKTVFDKAGGFREDLWMMEDQEIIHRLKKQAPFTVLPDVVTTSARKYRDNGVFRMQFIFYRLWAMYYLGYSQDWMLQVHRRLIREHKL